uniref:hypothetical protein n=1 Tax=Nocardioides sp. TaxID=35761 RepID=UPI002B273619
MSQDKPTLTAEPVVVTSAWPWRGSEQRMIVATAAMGLGLAVWLQGWWWIAAAVGLGCAFWLYRVGDYRKQRSLVTVTISS